MKFTLSWLKEFLNTDKSIIDISNALNAIGLEVESIENKAEQYNGFVVAEIRNSAPHPDADKLSVCTVYDGQSELQVVCGAPNARAGIKVVLAQVGAIVPNGNFAIKKSKIRGVESCGMLCSESELMLGDGHNGIIELENSAKPGTSFAEHKGLDDILIDISITPNRGDCTSVLGIARDLSAFNVGNLNIHDKPSLKRHGASKISVHIEDITSCREFYGAYIENVSVGSIPSNLDLNMRAIGSSKKLPLVDISNFIMFSYGRPNHIYDADKIDGNITLRKAEDNEKFIAIGGQEYNLTTDITVIADNSKVLAIAGVIGGELSKVTQDTKNIFVEMADFDPKAVSTAGRRLNIITDSRFRFERRVDPENTDYCLSILLNTIQQCCGGIVSENIISTGNKPEFIQSLRFDFDKTNALLGTSFTKEECYKTLSALGFKIDGDSVKIPSWRYGDVSIQEDLIEEVIRMKGYENIPSTPLERKEGFFSLTNNEALHTLRHMGMNEVVSWSFFSESDANIFGDSGLKIKNPISIELNTMRSSILAHLIRFAANHINRGSKNVCMFEMGPIYSSTYETKQTNCLSGIRTGSTGLSPHNETRDFDFFDIKADLFSALQAYNVNTDSLQITRECPPYYHSGQSASFKIGKTIVAQCGAIHPGVLNNMEVEQPLFAFEIFIDKLPYTKNKFRSYQIVSNLQPIIRDFAFIVNKDLEAIQLTQTIKKSDENIKYAKVFDVYFGKGIEEGKKSIAVSILIQPKEKTLTDAEIECISKNIIEDCEKKLNASLRSR